MIIEFTFIQFMMTTGIIMLAIGIIAFIQTLRGRNDGESIIGAILSGFGILFILSALNMEYGFLVFRLVPSN